MDKYTAGRIEGLLFASRRFIESIAAELRKADALKKRPELFAMLGIAATDLLDISWAIYEEHPGLNPYPEETKLAALMRRGNRKAIRKKPSRTKARSKKT